ncbi:hypothetical protein PQ478_19565 [Alkalihalophilus pseudofirmus]|uniref:hypothetical protein n=1 Tax=Alkalihalophilus pseudofirmus TaxID=79885 RepID=UPI00259AF46A|nr:hypothetical protein [Alkalihalophilus pseudofirmus]WEG16678.1 hypothetical protein PQ478_19565 [Alkalihalophilus pseudofirmus]
MGFLKELGSFVGTVTGSVAGGAIKVVGEVSGSKFIGEIGDGVKNASQFAGDKLGEAASGAWDIGASIVTQDSNRMDQGFNDLGKATGDTQAIDGDGIVSAEESVSTTAESVEPGTHNVDPHYVNGYERADGTVVEGYWRDGDGDTSVNLSKEDGGGYERSNPDGDPTNNLNS